MRADRLTRADCGRSDPAPRPFKKVEQGLNAGGGQLTTTLHASAKMARVRQAGTKPEIAVRRMIAALKQRYTTNNRDLPGSPDLANRSRRWAIFVHGCYWHHHRGCRLATTPRANRAFWEAKFSRNRLRDALAVRKLRTLGFAVVIVWQCQTRKAVLLQRHLSTFFDGL